MPILINVSLFEDDFKLRNYDLYALWISVYKNKKEYEFALVSPDSLYFFYTLISFKSRMNFNNYENFYEILTHVYNFNKKWMLEDSQRFHLFVDVHVFINDINAGYLLLVSTNNPRNVSTPAVEKLKHELQKYNNHIEISDD